MRMLGCEHSKFSATRQVTVVEDRMQAAGLLAGLADPGSQLILTPGRLPLPAFKTGESNPVEARVKVVAANANRLHLRVESKEQDPYWLHYAEAAHPGWRAYVDGVEVPLAISQLAFKAIPLSGGNHEVVLEFRPGLMASLAWIHAVLTLLAGLAMVGLLLKVWGADERENNGGQPRQNVA
ncbi:MAG: YfhO family protein, partial [Magnetococcales bacterium]|nr:YfhO family protein [Magnetococcales bacterium]